jgi:hypothetical protein
MVAARRNAALKAFRDRRIAAGKPKLVALVAVARKLLTMLDAILRDRRPWSEPGHAPASIRSRTTGRGRRGGQGQKPRMRGRASARLERPAAPRPPSDHQIRLDRQHSRSPPSPACGRERGSKPARRGASSTVRRLTPTLQTSG